MASDKNPVRTIRVAPGSALERLIAGKPFTEAVHKIAEVLELAMAEEAAAENDQVEDVDAAGADEELREFQATPMGHWLHTAGEREFTQEEHDALMRGEVPTTPPVQPYDPFAPLDVTDDEAVLRAVAEQYPSGLVPVSVIHEDDDDNPMDLI